jgi:tetratricopeptide (TPR) repeat protein
MSAPTARIFDTAGMFIFATRSHSVYSILRHSLCHPKPGIRVAISILALMALVPRLQSQCQPTEFARAESGKPTNATTETPQFYDQPQFTVAGVADTTNLGGHGSDTVVRTKEALAKDTVSLGKPTARDLPIVSLEATEKLLRDAVAHDPASFEANRRFGKLLVDNGNARDALPYLEHAAQLKPDDYDIGYQVAVAYANTGKYDDARLRARALLARQDRAELHHLLGDVEERAGNPLEAVQEYQRAAEMNPSESHLFDWGAELLAHRAAEPAIEVFARGNRLFPRSVRMLVALGVSWYSRGSYAQSAACVFEASDLNPGDPIPYLFMGKMLNAEAAESQGFVDKLGRFARLQPENAAANYYYAAALWKARKDSASISQVESLLNKATLLDSKLGDAHLLLGVLHSDQGDFPKAITAYQRAIQSDPQREEPHYRLAQLYRRVGEKAKSQQELQLYEQLQKKSEQQVERERHEIQQFVFRLRDGDQSAPRPPKP